LHAIIRVLGACSALVRASTARGGGSAERAAGAPPAGKGGGIAKLRGTRSTKGHVKTRGGVAEEPPKVR
jgi:hypothetical protein